jgi:hypothetical protein
MSALGPWLVRLFPTKRIFCGASVSAKTTGVKQSRAMIVKRN